MSKSYPKIQRSGKTSRDGKRPAWLKDAKRVKPTRKDRDDG